MLIDAIVGHLCGDYLLQNDWMASNKKRSSLHCLVHCLIWTGCVCSFGGITGIGAVILFVTHFIQDRTSIVSWYMDTVGQKSFRTGACAPWAAIVVDNVFHIVTIWAVCKFL